jgi:hypothetical protein
LSSAAGWVGLGGLPRGEVVAAGEELAEINDSGEPKDSVTVVATSAKQHSSRR